MATSSSRADCALARFSDVPCEGPVHRIHLIPGQVIRRRVGLHAVWDERSTTNACVQHHSDHDLFYMRPPRSELPPAVEEFATEYALGEVLDALYGVRP